MPGPIKPNVFILNGEKPRVNGALAKDARILGHPLIEIGDFLSAETAARQN